MSMVLYKKGKRAVALLCMLTVFLSCFCMFGGQQVKSATASETKKKMEDLQKQLVEKNKAIAQAKDEIEEAKQRAATYSERVSIVSEQIDILQGVVDDKKEELRIKQEELDAKEREHDETYELFKKRLGAMYMNNNVTLLSLILGSNSFSEFLVAAEMQSRISKHDTELVKQLQEEADAIEVQRAEVEKELTSLNNDMSNLEDKYNELASLLREANSDMSTAQAYKEATEEEYSKILDELEKTQQEWNAIMGTGMKGYVGGYFAWPVPGYSWISSKFGWRVLWGRQNWHGGVDIAGGGIYGKPIIASNQGSVRLVRYYTTGYGYHVMIDHGDDTWTVYGHMSAIAVSEGDWVYQGQVIGYVGSTGNSTGPHLHFEIRINGEKVDPLNYISYGN